MYDLSLQDVQEIWDQTEQKTWEGLMETLEAYKRIDTHIPASELDQMLIQVEDFELADQPFPKDAEQLMVLLNTVGRSAHVHNW